MKLLENARFRRIFSIFLEISMEMVFSADLLLLLLAIIRSLTLASREQQSTENMGFPTEIFCSGSMLPVKESFWENPPFLMDRSTV